jgi:hypothetical protein
MWAPKQAIVMFRFSIANHTLDILIVLQPYRSEPSKGKLYFFICEEEVRVVTLHIIVDNNPHIPFANQPCLLFLKLALHAS